MSKSQERKVTICGQGESNVEAYKLEIERKLHYLCDMTSSDFSAFARLSERDHTIHWKYAVGNKSDRYKQMVGKPGRGLSGSVVRFGRDIVVDKNTPNYDKTRLEYPIMLAENLHSAIAVPIHLHGKINGILLIGSRSLQEYSQSQINHMKKAADDFASYFYKGIS